MNNYKKPHGSSDIKSANSFVNLKEEIPIKSEQTNGSAQAESEALEFPDKSETIAATNELLKILSVIALRISAKRQQHEHLNK
jgi:hypothetical protein